MSKEQSNLTSIEELKISIKYLYLLDDITLDAYKHLMKVCSYLLTKEKEQREGEIKKAFTDGANWELYGDDKTQEERAEQYYNEVFKPKHLNK